jgi:malonyl-CoA/methylmalonyl-CoA synthetase
MRIVPRAPPGHNGSMTTTMLSDRVTGFGDRVAVVDPHGEHTYAEIDAAADRVARRLGANRSGAVVSVLCRPGADWLAAVLGTWRAGGVVVALEPSHPAAELAHPITDSGTGVILCSPMSRALAERLAAAHGCEVIDAMEIADASSCGDRAAAEWAPPVVPAGADALIVYTSGTTGRPKGVVHTHASLAAQISGMVESWGWTDADRIVCILPLHHVHGIVNVTLCPLWVGAVLEAPGGFDANDTWDRMASGEVTVFMAVPTVYSRLIAAWEGAASDTRRRWSDGAARLRLMVSGSAALPVSTLTRWEEITGHVLLERYGMTELGMVLSNSLDRRVPGHVGWPFPGVDVRIVDEEGAEVPDGSPGELLVRGPQVFDRYLNRPDATDESFDGEWFRTGDVAVLGPDGYRLLGRASVDILKSGGEKVSALEIEEVYRTHRAIVDCAVVGLPDDDWGQRVVMAWVPSSGDAVPGDDLRAWGKERLAPAKVPVRFMAVDSLPRNPMGKVLKPAVADLFD